MNPWADQLVSKVVEWPVFLPLPSPGDLLGLPVGLDHIEFDVKRVSYWPLGGGLPHDGYVYIELSDEVLPSGTDVLAYIEKHLAPEGWS